VKSLAETLVGLIYRRVLRVVLDVDRGLMGGDARVVVALVRAHTSEHLVSVV
jgi:hypothetical protein